MFLTEKEESDLIHAWQESDHHKSAEKILNSFRPLVFKIIRKYSHYGVSQEDLIQEALMGVVIALKRFDLKREIRFSSYAKWWINACCQEFVMRNWSMVRLGSSNKQKKLFFQMQHIKRLVSELDTDFLDDKTAYMIAEHVETSIEEVKSIFMRLQSKDRYLDEQISGGDNISWMDTLVDQDSNVEESALQHEIYQKCSDGLKRAITCLDEKEWKILKRRRLSSDSETLEAIGKDLNITKERVRQIESKALRKLQKKLIQEGIRPRTIFTK